MIISETSSPAPCDSSLFDHEEVVLYVGRIAKLLLFLALTLKILLHLPLWLSVAASPDFNITGFIIKFISTVAVTLILTRTLYVLWTHQGPQLRAGLEEKLQLCLFQFSQWMDSKMYQLKQLKFPRRFNEESSSLPTQSPVTSYVLPGFRKAKRRPWINPSLKLGEFWKKLTGKQRHHCKNRLSSTPKTSSKQASELTLPSVSEWDRIRLMQIIQTSGNEASRTGGSGRSPLTQPYLPNTWGTEVNESRSADELTLNYYRRPHQPTKGAMPESESLFSGSHGEKAECTNHSSFKPLSISEFPVPSRSLCYASERSNRILTTNSSDNCILMKRRTRMSGRRNIFL